MELTKILQVQRYFGRGIIVGKSPNDSQLFLAYFLMGRSANSQNRFFYLKESNLQIGFANPDRVEDPSLIFYPPILHQKQGIIITNGSQTQVISKALEEGQSFEEALRGQSFEPDVPHFTPRISSFIQFKDGGFSYKMSLLKALSAKEQLCNRFFYEYESLRGVGHFLHTYDHDADPLPSFCGEPKILTLPETLEELGELIWEQLDSEYKISLCVQSVQLQSQKVRSLIFNAKEPQCLS